MVCVDIGREDTEKSKFLHQIKLIAANEITILYVIIFNNLPKTYGVKVTTDTEVVNTAVYLLN